MPFPLLLFPARSAGGEDCLSFGGFRGFPFGLFGPPFRLSFLSVFAFGLAGGGFGRFLRSQFGCLPLLCRSSLCLAFRDPATASGDDLITSFEPLGAFRVFGETLCAFQPSLFGSIGHAQAIGKTGSSHREC